MFFDPGSHKQHGLRHDPFKAIVSPRPIGWISSISADGRHNLAPYSFFNAMSYGPPIIAFGAGNRPGGGKKDSILNIEETGEFVHNVVSYALRDKMNETSIHIPHGDSEFEHSGLEGLPSTKVKPLRVKGAPIHLECRYIQTIDLPSWHEGGSNSMVIGEVIGIHIDESVINDGLVDVLAYQPVSRLGYFDYAHITEVFALSRPKE
jgi:flavin reductase (DIM6/NTAB) family NADH-FMN oxidoreductase RutF